MAKVSEELKKNNEMEEKGTVEESGDISEISMTVAGVEAVGYDITGNGEPDYCGFVNEETGGGSTGSH